MKANDVGDFLTPTWKKNIEFLQTTNNIKTSDKVLAVVAALAETIVQQQFKFCCISPFLSLKSNGLVLNFTVKRCNYRDFLLSGLTLTRPMTQKLNYF